MKATLYILISGVEFEDCQYLTGDSAWERAEAEEKALKWMEDQGWANPIGNYPRWEGGAGYQDYLKVDELEVDLPK